jgi:heme/copper-type cytochrome/quinol oxidase subunit 1
VKKVLIIRLLIEAMFGFCMAGLLLIPEIWRGTFLQQFILGYLGMPRRYHASAEIQRVNVITLGGLLTVTIVLLIGVLCFKDVFKIVRKLRVSYHES